MLRKTDQYLKEKSDVCKHKYKEVGFNMYSQIVEQCLKCKKKQIKEWRYIAEADYYL